MNTLETDRLLLTPISLADAPDLWKQVYGSDDVMEFLPGRTARTLERTEDIISFYLELWEQEGFGLWAVRDKGSGALLGDTGLGFVEDTRTIEVFYAFGVDHWGKGYATESARAVLWYGFEVLRLTRLVGLTDPDNIASQRVLEKVGMAYVKMTKHYNMKLRYYALNRAGFNPGDGLFRLMEESDK